MDKEKVGFFLKLKKFFLQWRSKKGLFGNSISNRLGAVDAAVAVCLMRSAPVAQLDRASDYGSEGWGFDSLRARA